MVQSNLWPDYTFGLWGGNVTKLIKQPIPSDMEALLGIAPGMFDRHLIVEGQADLGTSGDTEIQARRRGAIVVNTDRMLRETA